MKKKRKKIFIIGAYACGNRGDDVLLQSLIDYFGQKDIVATFGKEKSLISIFGIKSTSCRMCEGVSLSIILSTIKDSFGILFQLLKSDALIFGGGSLIHDLTKFNLPFMYFWHTIALLFRKKVYYYAMGVGPILTKSGIRLSKFFLSRATLLFVRDLRGEQICHSLGIRDVILTSDGAFSITKRDQCNLKTLQNLKLKPKEYFCVTASEWFESSNFWNRDQIDVQDQIDNFVLCIKTIHLKVGLRIIFVPTVQYDEKLALKIAQYFNPDDFSIVPSSYNHLQMSEIIENCYMLFGVRMHSLIFAARQSVPFIAAIYDEKVTQLLRNLEMEEYGILLKELNSKWIEDRLDYIINHYQEIQNHLRKTTEKLYVQSINCLNIISKDLNN